MIAGHTHRKSSDNSPNPMPIVSGSEFKSLKGTAPVVSPAATSGNRDLAPSVGKPGFLERLKGAASDTFGDLADTGRGIINSATSRSDTFNQGIEATLRGQQSPLRLPGQLLGEAAGGAADIAGELTKGGVKVLLQQEDEDTIKNGLSSAIAPLAPIIAPVMDRYEKLKTQNPALARDIDAALGFGEFATTLFSGGVGSKAGKLAGESVAATKTVARGVADSAAQSVDDIASSVAPAVRKAGEALQMAGEGAARIPGRIATNVAEKAATREAIQALPSPIAQKAARDGIDIADINTLSTVVPKNKTVAQKLLKVVQDVSDGRSKADPRAIVGKPIVTRLQAVEAEANKIGARLGAEAEKIGTISAPELKVAVFSRLTQTPGLAGLKVTSDGKLLFRETTIANNAAAKKALQTAYTQATAWGKGSHKHLLRQELFESLKGAKRNLATSLTATQEKGLEAVRKGLSDALEAKSPGYKTLNQRYAAAIKPLNDLKKALKVEDADLQEVAAGILAQRLGGNSQATTQLKSLLRQLDNATAKAGKTSLNVDELLDMYNVLARYFDITPDNSFRGGIEAGIRASGIKDTITNAVVDIAGQSPAVRRKALEDLVASLVTD
jgi:hypothetical protein